MKKQSLKSVIILIAITTACNLPGTKNETTEQYNRAMVLLHRAEFLRHEGDIDSAVTYYQKSLALCQTIEKQIDPGKDTAYGRKIAHLNNSIGWLFDSLTNYEGAIPYLFQSLTWAKHSKDFKTIVSSEYNIGFTYYKIGSTTKAGSAERKLSYSKGITYAISVSKSIDSLGLHEYKRSLGAYAMCDVMYRELGDSAQAQFYRNKYKELKAQSLNITGSN